MNNISQTDISLVWLKYGTLRWEKDFQSTLVIFSSLVIFSFLKKRPFVWWISFQNLWNSIKFEFIVLLISYIFIWGFDQANSNCINYISKENILLVRPLYNNPYTLKTDTFFNKIRQPRSTVKRKSPEWGEGLTYKLQIISETKKTL